MTSKKDKLAQSSTRLKAGFVKLEGEAKPQTDHPANLNNYRDRGYYEVAIEDLQPDPNQPRKYFNPEAMQDLANSVKQKGIIQPVIFRRDSEGKFLLVAGERRWRAAKMAGLEQIPAILRTDNNVFEVSLIENLQRENLRPIEEAEALSRMTEEHGYTQEKLAFVIGKAKSTISETISLNRLPETIKEEVRRAEPKEADKYPRRLLVEIVKQKTEEAMISLFNQAKEGQLKSEAVRKIARNKPDTSPIQKTPSEIAINRVQSLNAFLDKIIIEEIDQDEKELLLTELKKLKDKFDEIFVLLSS